MKDADILGPDVYAPWNPKQYYHPRGSREMVNQLTNIPKKEARKKLILHRTFGRDKRDHERIHGVQQLCQVYPRHQRKGDTTNRWKTWARRYLDPVTQNGAMTFETSDANSINYYHNDPLVIEIMIQTAKS